MPPYEHFVPETSRISEFKRLALICALAGIGVGLLRHGLPAPGYVLTERDAHYALTIMVELGGACLLGAIIVFYSIRRIRWWIVEATWWVLLLLMFFALGTIIEWNGIKIFPF